MIDMAMVQQQLVLLDRGFVAMDKTRTNPLYEADEYSWYVQQIALLRTGAFDAIDRKHLIEFLEEAKKDLEWKIRCKFRTLLQHMLKFTHDPTQAARSWAVSIISTRIELKELIAANPGLKHELPRLYEKAYSQAVKLAAAETGWKASWFPETNPWSLDEALNYEPPDPADLNPILSAG